VTGRPRHNFRLAKPLFVREANASFGYTHHTSSVAMKKCTSLGGTATATKCDVKIWYFLFALYKNIFTVSV
jgi:hypothetical protein